MEILKKTRNVARGLTQRYGPANLKRRLWDSEFSGGRWDCLDSMPGDCVYPYIERYANQGSILDLGCGPGATGTELAADTYTSYTGVDISAVAVEKARKSAVEHHRAGTNSYFQGDIFTYVPTQQHDTIVFGDSLYYIPWRRILTMLNRYSRYLKPGGVFVVRLNGRRYQEIVDVIEEHFEILEKQLYAREVFVIAFRPLQTHPDR